MKHAWLLGFALAGLAWLPAAAQDAPGKAEKKPVAKKTTKPVHRPLVELFTSQG